MANTYVTAIQAGTVRSVVLENGRWKVTVDNDNGTVTIYNVDQAFVSACTVVGVGDSIGLNFGDGTPSTVVGIQSLVITGDVEKFVRLTLLDGSYFEDSFIDNDTPYVLPIMTADLLGGAKVGPGLAIDPVTGVLSVPCCTTPASVPCGVDIEYKGGESFPTTIEIELGSGTGTVTLKHNAFGIPDRFVLMYEGVPVIDTGYRGNTTFQTALDAALTALGEPTATIAGAGLGVVSFEKTTGTTTATLLVYAPIAKTKWQAFVSCPGAGVEESLIDTNFATTDLTFTGDRTHDLAGYQLQIRDTNTGFDIWDGGLYGTFGSAWMDVEDAYFQAGADNSWIEITGGVTSIGYNGEGVIIDDTNALKLSSYFTNNKIIPSDIGKYLLVVDDDGNVYTDTVPIVPPDNIITGSITATQVGFGSPTNTLTSSPEFTYDNFELSLTKSSISADIRIGVSDVLGDRYAFKAYNSPSIVVETPGGLGIIGSGNFQRDLSLPTPFSYTSTTQVARIRVLNNADVGNTTAKHSLELFTTGSQNVSSQSSGNFVAGDINISAGKSNYTVDIMSTAAAYNINLRTTADGVITFRHGNGAAQGQISSGGIKHTTLAGTGTRNVVALSDGTLSIGAGFTTADETDPIFSASDAATIDAVDITNWNTAFIWGNHASAGYLHRLDDLTGTTGIQVDLGNGSYLHTNDNSFDSYVRNADGSIVSEIYQDTDAGMWLTTMGANKHISIQPTNAYVKISGVNYIGGTDKGLFLDGSNNVIVQNAVTASSTTAFTNKSGNISQWTNNSGYITSAALSAYALDANVVHLAGAETITGAKTFNPAVTASGGIGRGVSITGTITANANSNALVGLDITPAFSNGAFSNVTNTALRVTGPATGHAVEIKGTQGAGYANLYLHTDNSTNTSRYFIYAKVDANSSPLFYVTQDGGIYGAAPSLFDNTVIYQQAGLSAIKLDHAASTSRIRTTGTFAFELGVNNTSYLKIAASGTLNTLGSITAASALAQGVKVGNTLVAAANNDVLVGLDVAPTFTNGAFTGVVNYGLRIQGSGAKVFIENLSDSTGVNREVVVNNGVLGYQNAYTRSVTTLSATATIGSASRTDYIYFLSGTFSVTQPTAVGNTNRYIYKNVGSGTITLNRTGSETLENATSVSITAGSQIELMGDNTNWWIISTT